MAVYYAHTWLACYPPLLVWPVVSKGTRAVCAGYISLEVNVRTTTTKPRIDFPARLSVSVRSPILGLLISVTVTQSSKCNDNATLGLSISVPSPSLAAWKTELDTLDLIRQVVRVGSFILVKPVSSLYPLSVILHLCEIIDARAAVSHPTSSPKLAENSFPSEVR